MLTDNLQIILNVFYQPTDQLKKFIQDDQSSDKLYFPINGGSNLTDDWSNVYLQKDNVGKDNISHLNNILNEMTSIYWFWKNKNPLPMYIGFNHYRRFFKRDDIEDYNKFDMIVAKPIWSSNAISLAQQYKYYHIIEDLQTCLQVIEDVIGRTYAFNFANYLDHIGINYAPCNMFIMKKALFEEWCNFIFPILFELKNRICDSEQFMKRDNYQKRALCFLTERMFNYWYYLRKQISYAFHSKEVDIQEYLDFKPKNINERGDFTT